MSSRPAFKDGIVARRRFGPARVYDRGFAALFAPIMTFKPGWKLNLLFSMDRKFSMCRDWRKRSEIPAARLPLRFPQGGTVVMRPPEAMLLSLVCNQLSSYRQAQL
jgi:hypothetical protein